MQVSAWSTSSSTTTRRRLIQNAGAAFSAICIIPSAQAAQKDLLLEELRLSKEKLADIPPLLEEKEWDKVRSILKLPPVNKLWNLGDVRIRRIASNFQIYNCSLTRPPSYAWIPI